MAHFQEPAATHFEGVSIAHLDAVDAQLFRQAYRQCQPYLRLPCVRPLRMLATAHPNYSIAPPLHARKKLLHFVRHGEALHNVAASEAGPNQCYCDTMSRGCVPCPYYDIFDPALTDCGRHQATSLQPITSFHTPELVVMSPLTRAIETAVLAYAHLLKQDASVQPPWVCNEAARARIGLHACDQRRSVAALRSEFAHIDFGTVETDADAKWTLRRESMPLLVERALAFMQWIADRPESEIAIISSSTFFCVVFLAVLDTGDDAALRCWFRTGELRSVIVEFATSE